MDYYEKTKRGRNYTKVTDYLATVNFPTNYNIATLYKVLNDKENTKNQILWALNLIGVETQFELPHIPILNSSTVSTVTNGTLWKSTRQCTLRVTGREQ